MKNKRGDEINTLIKPCFSLEEYKRTLYEAKRLPNNHNASKLSVTINLLFELIKDNREVTLIIELTSATDFLAIQKENNANLALDWNFLGKS
jgi:hypothetical protein